MCILTSWGREEEEESRKCGLGLKHIYILKKNTKKIGIWSDDGESKLSSSRRVRLFLGVFKCFGRVKNYKKKPRPKNMKNIYIII